MQFLSVITLLSFLALMCAESAKIPKMPKRPKTPNKLVLDDLRFTPKQKQQMRTRMFMNYATKWTNGIIPYIIDPVIQNDPVRLQAIKDAVKIYNTQTCARWIPRTTEINYVKFMDSGYGKCHAYYGMASGAQDLSLGGGCGTVGTVLHEMMHTLGFVHEHQRPDRDQYVTVQLDNIETQYQYAYDKMNPDQVNLQNLRYDYDSVMHYFYNGFGINGRTTLVTKDSSKQYSIGMSNVFSKCDLEKINKMYQCTNLLTNDASCKMSTETVGPTCSDSSACPQITTSNCMEYPGYYLPRCQKLCNNCDGKTCVDTTVDYIYQYYCKNTQISCDDWGKQIACPKLCGKC
jgi:hypothetical protein